MGTRKRVGEGEWKGKSGNEEKGGLEKGKDGEKW